MPGMHRTPMSGMTMALRPFVYVMMVAIASLVPAHKLCARRPTVDLSLALAIVALGIAAAEAGTTAQRRPA